MRKKFLKVSILFCISLGLGACDDGGSSAPKRECKTNDDCKDAAKPVCSSEGKCVAASATPECKTNDDCKDAAKPVCSSEGKCVAASGTVDPCKGVTCKDGTCDRGVCVTEAMRKVKSGDSCDESFVEFCRGNEMVYCAPSGIVEVSDCASDGGCTLVRENDEEGEYILAWCRGKADQCKEAEQMIDYCLSVEDPDGDYSYESSYICLKNTEGTFTATDQSMYGDYMDCWDGCNVEGTQCKDAELVDGQCSTGQQEFCASHGFAGCTAMEGEPQCHDGKCDKDGDVLNKSCETDEIGSFVTYDVCLKDDNGDLVLIYIEDECKGKCNAEGTACAQ